MIWNTAAFSDVREKLLAAAPFHDANAIEQILQPISADLQQLLSSPPKSERSREEVSKKKIVIDGEEIELNDAFLNEAARIADELNLDEVVAAQLAFYVIEDAKRLGVGIFESALTLFYVRRQYIIDIVRFGLESLPAEKFNWVMGDSNRKLDIILDALKATERSLGDLDDKAKTAEFMGLDKNPDFTGILRMQKDFLVKEHEALGNVLFAYLQACASTEENGETLKSLKRHLAQFDTLDSRLLSYFPSLVIWFSAVHSEVFNQTLWAEFSTPVASGWKLPHWHAALALVAITALADEDRKLPASITYSQIKDAARHSIDNGALEFWFSFAQEVSSTLGDGYFDAFRPLVRSRIPNFTFWLPVPSQTTLENFQGSLEILFTGFITDLPDILKEMRLSEEDMYLAMNESEPNANATGPGLDLERFLLFVAVTCRGRPDASNLFFEDEGGALHGFLLWAADCQVTFMSAVFAELIASLANDEKTGRAVFHFLTVETKQLNQGEDGFILSWSSIYDVIEYYIRGLSAPQYSGDTSLNPSVRIPSHSAVSNLGHPGMGQPSASTTNLFSHSSPAATLGSTHADPDAGFKPYSGTAQKMQVVQTPPNLPPNQIQWGLPDSSNAVTLAYAPSPVASQLSDDTLLILAAYMSVISRVSVWCSSVSRYSCSKPSSNSASKGANEERDIVPLLFKLLKLQQPIVGSVLNALIPFASPEMWPLLDGFIVGKFEEVLLSMQDVLALIRLLEKLAEGDTPSPRLGDYLNFVLKTVLPWTARDAGSHNLCTLLQCSCLGFVKKLLSKTPHIEAAFRACFDAAVYQAMFHVLCTGIDRVNDLDASHPLLKTVTRGVEVVSLLMKLSVPPSWSFAKPVLYHLQVVPHVALYAGSTHTKLALVSIELLSQLDQSPEFRPTLNRQSRILSILTSTTESTRIRVGFMTLIDDVATDTSVKSALLAMMKRQLSSSTIPRHYMTVAHYLLGFNQSDLGLELKLELDSGVGGILSGSSLLSSVCDTLLRGLVSPQSNDGLLLKDCCEILQYLVEDPLTRELVLDNLRQFDFWLHTIECESQKLGEGSVNRGSTDYQAALLEVWICEIQLCQERLLLTIEGHYLDLLIPMVFSLIDFTDELPETHAVPNSLKAWCRLVPVLVASGDARTGPTFISRIIRMLVPKLPRYTRQNADYAVPIAKLLEFLLKEFLRRGADDSVARNVLELFNAALMSIQAAQVNTALRIYLYSISFQSLNLVLQDGSRQTQMDALILLDSCGQRVFRIASDDLLGYANENLRFGALLFIQSSVILSGRLGSNAVPEALLQYNFVSIFVEQVVRQGLIIASGRLSSSGRVEEITLNALGRFDNTPGSDILKYGNSNLPSEDVDKVLATASSTSQRHDDETARSQLAKISLSLLLPIAKTRHGAANILGTKLLHYLDAELSHIPDELLSLALQLLIALILSSGPENKAALVNVKELLERHKVSVEAILLRDAAIKYALQDQSTESEISCLARNFTILMSLTDAAP